MSVLHAWALGLGLAALVPLVLHLRRRRTDRRISFPALRYLSRAEDARSRSLVASDVLLLAIRMGLVAALALAAAGPLLGRGGAADHEPTDLALVLDNSASVFRVAGDGALFDLLRERAVRSLENVRSEDRVWIFATVGGAVAAGVSGPRGVQALDRIQPTDGAADLGEAVRRAGAALPADPGRSREVHLLSDLQRSAFGAPGDSGSTVPLVALRPPPPLEPNGAVTEARLTGGTTVPSGSGHGILVRTARFGPAGGDESDPAAEASIRLHLGERIAGAARSPWGTVGTLALPELEPGSHAGRVEIDPSGLRADDVRHFSVQVVPPPAVEFLGVPGSFVAIGIETLRDAGRIGSAGAPAVTVVEGAVPRAARLAGTTGRSTLVLIPPSDPVDAAAFNQLLAALGVAWLVRPDPSRGSLSLEAPADGGPSLAGMAVHRRYLLEAGAAPGTADSVILTTDDGAPWLVRTETEGGIALLLASPLDPASTDLPAHPAMIPFLEALLVQWSHVSGWPPDDFEAGTPLSLPPWAAAVETPEGEVVRVEGGGLYTPLGAGVYAVRGEDAGGIERETRFAANVPAAESPPVPASEETLSELFPGRPVFSAGPEPGEWTGVIFRARRGRDAAPWLLGLALALAIVELGVATPGRAGRRRSRPDRDEPDPETNPTSPAGAS